LLRRERLDLYQRELLLDTIIQTTPLVMVLTNISGRIVYSNVAARQLFHDGRKLEGLDFPTLLADSPAPLREALTAAGDTLFTMEVDGEPQVYHLSQRGFLLNAQAHRLVLLKQLTRRGAGLAENVLRDALLPFYSTKATGTGLGLTLCREIVEAHGGRLSIANRPDGGAIVSVWLPSTDATSAR
jgi:nitrogen-specific signal transduction histidine kinase